MLLRTCTFLLACCFVWSQAISTSQIKGTVQDSSGSAVPGAEVKVTQTATGAVRTVTSATDGGYIFTDLPVGPYQMEVSKEGFSKFVQLGIVLQVASNPTIEVTLKVGAVSEQIEVQANAAMVETQNTGVGQVIDQQRVVDLPLNGRQVTDLVLLTGGVSVGRSTRSSYTSSTAFSIAGGGTGTVAYILDGGTHNDPLSNQNLPLPFPDALQEFKVETSALPAQYGFHSAGSVNVVTKSGGNQVHGDAFEFVRNYLFNARNTFQPVRDSLKRNQFGGTIGGPIVKNRTFFFLGYQDTIVRSSPIATVAFVPNTAMLAGDFTTVTSTACRAAPLTLSAAQGFVGNKISPARFDPISLSLEKNLPSTSDPCGRITYAPPASSREQQGMAKIDHQITNKHSIFGRYFVAHYEAPPGDPSRGLLVQAIGGRSDSVFNATIGDTYLLSPTIVNSFRVTANRSSNTTVYNHYFGLPDLGVQGVYQLPSDKFGKYLAGWVTTGGFSIATTPSGQPYLTWQISDDVNMTRGAHQISLGGNFVNLKATAINYLNSNANFTFSGQFTGLQNADYLLGLPVTLTQAGPAYSDQHQNVFGLYIQDAWKASRNLTVNAGLRWDPFFGHTNPYGQVLTFSLPNFINSVVSGVYPNAPAGLVFGGEYGLPEGHYSPNKLKTFSPRLGVVWDPKGDGRMSIRAGFGFFYDFPNFAFDQFGFSQPFGANLTINPPSLNNPWSAFPGGNPYPLPSPEKFRFVQGNAANIYGYPLDVKPTYIAQYNLSVQRQLGRDWLVSASYLGNGTRHLWANNPVNQAQYLGPGACVLNGVNYTAAQCTSPTTTAQRRRFNFLNPRWGTYFGETMALDEGGTASYSGLILSAQHRFAKNFTSTTNYTWAHCISDNYATAIGLTTATESRYDNRRADRGDCPGADLRQAFNQTIVYASPKFSHPVLKLAASNWKIALSAIVQSGGVLNVAPGIDQALTGNAAVQRVSQLLPDVYLTNKGQNGWLNPKAFTQPVLGTFGNMGAGAVRGPGSLIVNMALSREFKIRERQSIEARGEAFNLPNRVNLYNPVTTLSAPNFGQIVPSGTASVNDPRIMQFALKYVF